jgi:cytochrome b561
MQVAARSTYSRVAIILHWTIALLMIGNLIGGLTHDWVPKESMALVMGIHKASGITILALSLVRLLWRLGHRPPPLAATLRRWEVGLAHATHWIFYVLMIALPMTGWLMTSAGSRKWPLSWFGLFDIPYLPVAQDKGFADSMGAAHEIAGYLMLGLVVMHVAAAIKHHMIDRDNTVERMLPGLRARS